jgi:hypothetical protein
MLRFRPFIVLIGTFASLAIAGTASAQIPTIDCDTEMYASSQSGDILAVNASTGAARVLFNIGGDTEGQPASSFGTELEYDPITDELWVESVNGDTEIVRVDPAIGAIVEVVDHGPVSLAGMEFINGVLYAAVIGIGGGGGSPEGGQGGSVLATVNLATGNLNNLGPITAPSVISGLAYDEATDTLYGITAGGVPADLITINRATGQATVVGPTGYTRIGSIEFGPDGFLYGGTTFSGAPNANALLRINPATGAATLVGTGSASITGLATCRQPTQPQEPAIPTSTPLGVLITVLLVIGAAFVVLRARS